MGANGHHLEQRKTDSEGTAGEGREGEDESNAHSRGVARSGGTEGARRIHAM